MDLEFNVLVKFPGNQPHLLLHSFIPSYQPRGGGREEEEGRRGGGGKEGEEKERRGERERQRKREEVMIAISAAILQKLFRFATRVKDITNS